MNEIGAFEAKNTLGTLLDRVQNGEEITITRHGKPVARLIPNEQSIDRQAAREASERIRSRARALPSHPFDWAELKAERDGERP